MENSLDKEITSPIHLPVAINRKRYSEGGKFGQLSPTVQTKDHLRMMALGSRTVGTTLALRTGILNDFQKEI